MKRDVSAARNDTLGNLEANALSAAGNDRGFAREVKCHDSNPLIQVSPCGKLEHRAWRYLSPNRHGGDNPSPNRVHDNSLKRFIN